MPVLYATWLQEERFELDDLMFGEAYSRKPTPAAQIALEGLNGLIGRLAAAGVLMVSQEEATFIAFASTSGAALSTYFLPKHLHQASFFSNIRESMISSITAVANRDRDGVIVTAATTLGGNLDQLKTLSRNERNLLHEWLQRIVLSP